MVELGMTYDNGKLVLSVRDTGTGMSKKQQEKIFEPFERLPNAAVEDGFGLGLPIVKNTATLLGGIVSVESEEGKGSLFTVKLPMPLADSAMEAKKKKTSIAATEHTDCYSVLVLDNDEMTLTMTKEMYIASNIHCDICTNTSDLMEAIRGRNYDLLITDLRMPETNGYDVLKLLRSSNVSSVRLTNLSTAIYEALVAPQSVAQGTAFVAISTTGGKTYVYRMQDNAKWTAGSEYSYTVAIR